MAGPNLRMAAGILCVWSSPGAQKFLGNWDGALRRSASTTEQGVFNAVVRRGMWASLTKTTELLSMEALILLCVGAGILYLRSSPGAQEFLGNWDAALHRSTSATEQGAFNAVVWHGM